MKKDATPGHMESGVEALSILANKERTKHFLEERIQADLSAAAAAAPSSVPSSNMSAPTTLSPPVGFTDGTASGHGLSAPLRAESSRRDLDSGDPAEAGDAVARPGAPETRIVREIAELRRREEELRRLHRSAAGAASVQGLQGQHSPASQEDPVSGYGSEDKESLAEDSDSRVRSGRAAVLPGATILSRSQESLSSGHSSGVGSEGAAEGASRRRVTVRPFEDQEESSAWNSFVRSAETPIEREIRLSREREEERRREQALRSSHTLPNSEDRRHAPSQSVGSARPAQQSPLVPERRQMALRLATTRVQHEIEEATRRELELRGEGKAITTSEETVDEKVTRPVDMVDLRRERQQPAAGPVDMVDLRRERQQPAAVPSCRPASDSTSHTPPASSRPVLQKKLGLTAASFAKPTPQQTAPTAVKLRSRSAGGAGRGLMQKFISSRGKLRPVSAFVASVAPVRSPSSNPARQRPASASASAAPNTSSEHPQTNAVKHHSAERSAVSRPTSDHRAISSRTSEAANPHRAGHTRRLMTAEEKIQLELQQMKQREDELRRERGRALARSQPDLLAALDSAEPLPEDDDEEEVFLPTAAPLTRTRSIPNLLNGNSLQTTTSGTNGRRRSVLIDQWESRIQGVEV